MLSYNLNLEIYFYSYQTEYFAGLKSGTQPLQDNKCFQPIESGVLILVTKTAFLTWLESQTPR